MGQIRFLVNDAARLPDDVLESVHMCGLEEIPWQSHTTVGDGELRLERYEDDSGSVRVPYLVKGVGRQLLPTATLLERSAPYLLEVELARGMINQVRNHLAAWEPVGLVPPQEVQSGLLAAMKSFARAATSQSEPARAAAHACEAIDRSVAAAYALGTAYAEQALAVRCRATPQLPTLLGVNLGVDAPPPPLETAISESFNLAGTPMPWRGIEAHEGKREWENVDRQIEWCQRRGLKICAGPLIQLDAAGIPDWMYLWEGDFDNLISFMQDHVKAVVSRYRGRVNLWQIAARLNVGDMLSLDEEQRLRIVVRCVERVRQLDPNTPVVVTFDRPWAEYMSREAWDLSPLHFADAIVRADIGVAGLGLEINVGSDGDDSPPRDPLSVSRLLDHWSLLGMPLMLVVSAPGSMAAPDQTDDALADTQFTWAGQRRWIETFVPLVLAKNSVQIILWNSLEDGPSGRSMDRGLFAAGGAAKPGLESLRTIRQSTLL